jgi:hypothetical protein
MKPRHLGWLVTAVVIGRSFSVGAADHDGRVMFSRAPVPGATVTATRGDATAVTTTNEEGEYRFTDLSDGSWTIRVEMTGFAVAIADVVLPSTPPTFRLQLLPARAVVDRLDAGISRRAEAVAAAPPPRPPATPAQQAPEGQAATATDGFLINGSVTNAAASPFAQPRAFGNNRPQARSLYSWSLGLLGGDSAWDARPFSFTGAPVSKPSYRDLHLSGTFGGPVKIPGLVVNGPALFLGYAGSADHRARTRSALMPTAAFRRGDLSMSSDASGEPVVIRDPATGLPFAGNVIPADRISPQASSLLAYYPPPNLDVEGPYNYEASTVTSTRQDSAQARATKVVNSTNSVTGTFAYQRTVVESTSLIGFEDTSTRSSFDASADWMHRFNPRVAARFRYRLAREVTRDQPFFSDRSDVAAEAGIAGVNADPENWGPPTVVFSRGIASLSDVNFSRVRALGHTASVEGYLNRGRQNITLGAEASRRATLVQSQEDPRGTFTFTGAATGSDFADFLLGLPATSSIAYGNPDKSLHAWSYVAYVTDQVRLTPMLTINAGVRWEYESPMTEAHGRLVNLDIDPAFAVAEPVVASDPTGPVTGDDYPGSLVRSDKWGVQPRLALSWRPIAGSSLVVRAGYGAYRNTSVYQSLALLLAQQPPLSTTRRVASEVDTPLTLADGLLRPAPGLANTFAVDPDFRVALAHNWQLSVQRDLPASLLMVASYLGTRGAHLTQMSLPNTYPPGGLDPCPSCPRGFAYVTSGGRSTRHAGQVLLRRRLRDGFTASVQYTLAKAMDNASSFSGATVNAGDVAQDWRDLDAEWAPSTFDQRHTVSVQGQYTTGVGPTLLRGWIVTTDLTRGSGTPLTPVYLVRVPGTGFVGIRPHVFRTPDGRTVYAPPPPGQWGSGGRHSLRGPEQLSWNAAVTRTFQVRERLALEWRIDVSNLLNRVTYLTMDTVVGSPQFGLPTSAHPMRKIQTSARLRF